MDRRDYGQLPPSLPPQLQQLTGLLHLHLSNCSLPSTLLASVTRLQSLHLEGAMLLPIAFDDDGPGAGTLALLDVLPKLKDLQVLHLLAANLDKTGIAPEPLRSTDSPQATQEARHTRSGRRAAAEGCPAAHVSDADAPEAAVHAAVVAGSQHRGGPQS